MPDGNRQLRDSGKTILDALVGCAVLALLGCMVLPALSKERDDARIAECADHLKQLGQAAHQYAADFEGKFFYNWYTKLAPDGSYDENAPESWYDEERIGRYILGWSQLDEDRHIIDDEKIKIGKRGFIFGTFLCPSDEADPARSYHMNYWASGVDKPEMPEQGFRHGALFDSHSDDLDRLLLFTDVVGTSKTSDGWVTAGRFGTFGSPGSRFGRSQGEAPRYTDPYHDPVVRRFRNAIASHLDYVRHGDNGNRAQSVGAVNIAYADGHVALKEHNDLFDPNTGHSTFDTLWSPIDIEIQNAFAHGQRTSTPPQEMP